MTCFGNFFSDIVGNTQGISWGVINVTTDFITYRKIMLLLRDCSLFTFIERGENWKKKMFFIFQRNVLL